MAPEIPLAQVDGHDILKSWERLELHYNYITFLMYSILYRFQLIDIAMGRFRLYF